VCTLRTLGGDKLPFHVVNWRLHKQYKPNQMDLSEKMSFLRNTRTLASAVGHVRFWSRLILVFTQGYQVSLSNAAMLQSELKPRVFRT
jgi:hypothetical protein